MSKVVIVNRKDNPIGLKSYADVRYEDIYRVSVLWLTDIKTGDCLITQRKWTEQNDPGKWMSAASGTIEESENYDENIVHEIEEEIGLTNLRLTKVLEEFIDEGKHKFFAHWYSAEVDKDKVTIIIQEDDVEAYKWISIKKLVGELKSNPDKYVPSFRNSLKLLGIVND